MLRVHRYIVVFVILLPLFIRNATTSHAQDTSSQLKAGSQAIINEANGQSIMIFSQPNSNSALGKLPSGLAVTLTRDRDTINGTTWYRIRLTDYEGYVSATVQSGNKKYDTLIPFSRESLNTAAQDLTDVLTAGPDAAASFKRGLIYLNLRAYDLSEADFDKVTKTDKTNVMAYYLGAIAAYQRGALNDAVEHLTKAIEITVPGDPILYNARAMVYAQETRKFQVSPDQALSDFNQAIQLNPLFASAYRNRASIYRWTDDIGQAFKDYSSTIRIDPQFGYAYLNLGNISLDSGDFKSALNYFSNAINAEPQLAEAYAQRGYVYGQFKKYAQAHADYEQALKLDPNFGWTYVYEGGTYTDEGKYAEAITSYEKAATSPADNNCIACAFRGLGRVYYLLNDLDKAIDYYSKAIQLMPNIINWYRERAAVYRAKGDLKAAQADLDTAAQLEAQLVQGNQPPDPTEPFDFPPTPTYEPTQTP